ncbi:MAG: hypothetical protein LC802_15685 [Acidobacteria bacterium]|nr:hypothetical protein [Acidobacteriota bacterium]
MGRLGMQAEKQFPRVNSNCNARAVGSVARGGGVARAARHMKEMRA